MSQVLLVMSPVWQLLMGPQGLLLFDAPGKKAGSMQGLSEEGCWSSC